VKRVKIYVEITDRITQSYFLPSFENNTIMKWTEIEEEEKLQKVKVSARKPRENSKAMTLIQVFNQLGIVIQIEGRKVKTTRTYVIKRRFIKSNIANIRKEKFDKSGIEETDEEEIIYKIVPVMEEKEKGVYEGDVVWPFEPETEREVTERKVEVPAYVELTFYYMLYEYLLERDKRSDVPLNVMRRKVLNRMKRNIEKAIEKNDGDTLRFASSLINNISRDWCLKSNEIITKMREMLENKVIAESKFADNLAKLIKAHIKQAQNVETLNFAITL